MIATLGFVLVFSFFLWFFGGLVCIMATVFVSSTIWLLRTWRIPSYNFNQAVTSGSTETSLQKGREKMEGLEIGRRRRECSHFSHVMSHII